MAIQQTRAARYLNAGKQAEAAPERQVDSI